MVELTMDGWMDGWMDGYVVVQILSDDQLRAAYDKEGKAATKNVSQTTD